MRLNNDLDLRHFISQGLSRSGKGYFNAKQLIGAKPKRIMVWNPKQDYLDLFNDWIEISGLTKLYDYLTSNKNGRISYTPVTNDLSEYSEFCYMSLAWGNASWGELWVILEEAGAFDNAGKAPKGCYELITQGAAMGIIVGYTIQSIKSGNKTILDNCDKIRIGYSKERDLKYIADNIDSRIVAEVQELKGKEAIIYSMSKQKIVARIADNS